MIRNWFYCWKKGKLIHYWECGRRKKEGGWQIFLWEKKCGRITGR